MKRTWSILMTLIISSHAAPAAPIPAVENPYQTQASTLCQAMNDSSQLNYEQLVSPELLAFLPYSAFREAFDSLLEAFGSCTRADILGPATLNHERVIEFHMTSGASARGVLGLGADGRINNLNIFTGQDPRVVITSWKDVQLALEKLGGQTSFHRKDPSGIIAAHDDKPLAIGSTFKLYVLGALWKKVKTGDPAWLWSRSLALQEQWRSFPDGEMVGWPAGARLSLFEFARKMIVESDNTATEHLFQTLGRQHIASTAREMGLFNKHPGNQPFLSATELIKLKRGQPSLAASYAKAPVEERQRILEQVKGIKRTDVCNQASCLEKALFIDTIEWFATTHETCHAITWLYNQNDGFLRETMRMNPKTGFIPIAEVWDYVGYKGGSEPGVLHLAFVTKKANQEAGCLTMSWNDETRGAYSGIATQVRFLDLAAKALKLAESR